MDPDLVEMHDGVLACSHGYRDLTEGALAHGNYPAFSLDQGESWGDPVHLPPEPHAGRHRAPCWTSRGDRLVADLCSSTGVQLSTCYTSLREVEPGRLLVAYDVGWWNWPIRYIARRVVSVMRQT